ncbi:hypothetical protein [Mycobacterium sp.]|uniref:hypothetical protein n=1 Tax=Mycobacterium sp. TaxID=1785 RepID=UPI000CA9DD4A|nr:hypothetical protein [Mycobacterium sp.]PJE06641.1 MAG: hypothetical protein CK428_23920 [Mycobacterium sp.]
MAEIDFAQAWYFLDSAGKRFHLRFRPSSAPPDEERLDDGTGQLIAVVADARRADRNHRIAITRSNVLLTEVESVLDGWEDWAAVLDAGTYRWISLPQIQRRIDAAGLGPVSRESGSRSRGAA